MGLELNGEVGARAGRSAWCPQGHRGGEGEEASVRDGGVGGGSHPMPAWNVRRRGSASRWSWALGFRSGEGLPWAEGVALPSG